MSTASQEEGKEVIKEGPSTRQKVKHYKQKNAIGRYLRRRFSIRDGKEVYKSRVLQRALKKALNNKYVKKETSDDARSFFWRKKWQYAIYHVLKAVKALRVVRSIKGGHFTNESLEPNLLRRMISEYSYSTWAADYARQQVLKCSETREASSANFSATSTVARNSEEIMKNQKPNPAIGFQFDQLYLPKVYEDIMALPPSGRDDMQLSHIADFLKTFSYFEGMPMDIITRLSSAVHVVRKPAGYVMYRAGDSADCFYIVLSGKLVIVLQQLGIDFVVATIKDGGQFGEHDMVEHEQKMSQSADSNLQRDNDSRSSPNGKVDENLLVVSQNKVGVVSVPNSKVNNNVPPTASMEEPSEQNDLITEVKGIKNDIKTKGNVTNGKPASECNDVLLDGDKNEVSVGKRGHNIITKTPVLCLMIPRDDYISIYNDVQKMHMNKKISTLRLMPIFKLCTEKEIKVLAKSAIIHRYKDKAIIAKEGHLAQFLYIVCDGGCRALMKVKNHSNTTKATGRAIHRNLFVETQHLKEGMTFGEIAIFENGNHQGQRGKNKSVSRSKYPASLVSNAYSEIMLVPLAVFSSRGKNKKISDTALELIAATASQSKLLYQKSSLEQKLRLDNKWRKKKSKVLYPLLSDTQYSLMKKNNELNQGYLMPISGTWQR